jgi:NhaP-type Na+/H+ or K+/H+ antiporter
LSHGILIQLAGILVAGVLAQWVAWRLRLPSILLLLATGVLLGPVGGWLQPDDLFGELMLPLVSLAVAVILYEGGLNLELRELRNIGGVFFRLTTISVLISWLIGSLAAHWVLGLPWQVAALLGSILVVTGPTVIGPILRHLRLRGKVGSLLKWEGIIIDPVGATLAVLVFTFVQASALEVGVRDALFDLGRTLVAGVAAGLVAAGIHVLALSKFWIPDSLHNPVSLMLMFVAFTLANVAQEEAGLLAVTVMGIALANQKWVTIGHIVEFKENLTVLLISCLFVTLSARLQPADLLGLGWESFLFVAIMIVIARPLSVLAATWRSSLTWQERLFLCCMAPRGIVAAAISSVFALSLASAGYARAAEIVPVTFLVVFLTVLIYGLSAGPLARRLGLVQESPQGVLFIGSAPWVRELANSLYSDGFAVFVVDTNWDNIRETRMAGLPCYYGSALADTAREDIDQAGLGRMIAVTSNNEVNSLACLQYRDDFGRREVYQLPFSPGEQGRHEAVPKEQRGRFLFGETWTYQALAEFTGPKPRTRKTKLTTEYNFEQFLAENQDKLLPVLLQHPDGSLRIWTMNEPPIPKAGDVVISLARSEADPR